MAATKHNDVLRHQTDKYCGMKRMTAKYPPNAWTVVWFFLYLIVACVVSSMVAFGCTFVHLGLGAVAATLGFFIGQYYALRWTIQKYAETVDERIAFDQ